MSNPQELSDDTSGTVEALRQAAASVDTVAVISFDPAGRILRANQVFFRIIRCEDAEARRRCATTGMADWIPGWATMQEGRGMDAQAQPLELECLRADGTRWTAWFASTRVDAREETAFLVDISERKLAERALLEADLRKDRFLATLAHELRNPLAPMRNALHVLQLTGGQGDPAASAMRIMDRQINQMVRLVDDLLDINRIGSGRIDLRLEILDLATVVADAVSATASQFESAGVHLMPSHGPERLVVEGDRARLTQVVGNLLLNAAKFSKAGDSVEVAMSREGDNAIIRVRDHGVGIEAEDLQRIFELFTQVERSRQRTRSGLGVGLTLARQLVELHHGTIEARSEGLGLGAEFVVCLPLCDTPSE